MEPQELIEYVKKGGDIHQWRHAWKATPLQMLVRYAERGEEQKRRQEEALQPVPAMYLPWKVIQDSSNAVSIQDATGQEIATLIGDDEDDLPELNRRANFITESVNAASGYKSETRLVAHAFVTLWRLVKPWIKAISDDDRKAYDTIADCYDEQGNKLAQ